MPASKTLSHRFQLAVDVGGTFTDLVCTDETGTLQVLKLPTVPDEPSEGVMSLVAMAAEKWGLSLPDFLSQTGRFVHGTTIATNTMLEGKGARVGLLTTHGFRDSLEIRRGFRDNQWNHRKPYPPVLVPRYLRLGVRGRIDKTGHEIDSLDHDDIAAAVKVFEREQADSIAICLFNSYLADQHEQACREQLLKYMTPAMLSLSSVIAPIVGEYERTSTVVVNAYLGPRVIAYLHKLNESLDSLGLEHPILLLQSNGGMISLEELSDRPVSIILSGPAAAVGALSICDSQLDTEGLISMEMGGTSCDVLLMKNGEVETKDQFTIAGYEVAVPSVDIHTIGAGGGTIAHVDAGGLLNVGPRGAGALPGPVCYGKGGQQVTITDAQLVLGRLREGTYLDGALTLSLDPARQALAEQIARPLGIDVEHAALGMISILEQHLLHAVEEMSVQRGHNPKNYTLVAGGGAGPMHGCAIARALGCRQVYVPLHAGVFCAVGMLSSDIRRDHYQVHFDKLETSRGAQIDSSFKPLLVRATDSLLKEGIDPSSHQFIHQVDLRYKGQQWTIPIECSLPFATREVRCAFEKQHQALYGHMQPQGRIEVTGIRTIAIGRIEPFAQTELPPADERCIADVHRPVFWPEAGFISTAVYDGTLLDAGFCATGPAIVEETTTTIVVASQDEIHKNAYGNYLIDIGAHQ